MMTSDRGAGWLRRLAVALCILAQLPGVALWGQTGDRDPFADCEARVDARPQSLASHFCFVETARATQLWDEAKRKVTAHLKSTPADPYPLFTLGFLELESGSVPKAAEHFRASAESFAERGESRNETLAWNNVAECRTRQGQLDEAGRALQHAVDAARASGDPRSVVRVGIRQAQLLRRHGGDLERAGRILQDLEEELAGDTTYRIWRSLLAERAAVLHRLGRYEETQRTYERWAELARSSGELHDVATAWSGMAVNAAARSPRTGARDRAIRLARRALEQADEVGNRSAALTAHQLLGKLLPGEEGRAHLEECLRLTASAGESLDRAGCLFSLAGSLAAEDPERARSILDNALALALTSEEPWTAALGWAERFRVSWATLPRRDAAADSLAVLDHIEALRRLQSSETGRAGFFTEWVKVYQSLAGFLLDAPDGPSRDELETAFSVSERLRARVLLDSLTAARVESPPPRDPALAKELTGVLEEKVRIQRRLQDPGLGEGERTGLLAELEVLDRDLAEVDSRLGVAAASALPEHGFVELSQVEEALPPEQAVFSFLVAPDEDIYGKFAGGSWLLAVTSSGTRAYRLPETIELEAKVGTFLGLVEGRLDTYLGPGAATLYDDLLGAALAELPAQVEDLILVPDGVLHLLPFDLLRPHPQADPLAASHRLAAVPSVTLWHRWRQAPAVAPAAALALADPDFVGASEGARAELGPVAAADRQWALETGGLLGRLPYAVKEGRAVVGRLGGPPSRVRVGDEASEAFLKSAPLDEFGVLHFAAHALVDDQRPRRSAVLLAAGATEEDGLLQPREIAALDLAGKLVVVSACESGSGQVLLGEGVQSLARAFFRAGARAVVASLWRLEDDDAAAFFDLFYRALADGDSVAGAAAQARRELWRDGAPAAAWAGVVVLGDGGMVPVPGGVSRFGWWPLLWVSVVAAALLAVWRRVFP